jgi:hypothetical protein
MGNEHPCGFAAFECPVLNQNILFDLELLLARKGLTGQDDLRSVWMYCLEHQKPRPFKRNSKISV